MSPSEKRVTPVLRKQPIMRRVVIASVSCIAGSVYYFGWRSLAVVAVSCLLGFLTEYLFPVALTSRWAVPAQGPWGALKEWTTAVTPDAITAATPMTLAKFGEAPPPEWVDLLIGRMSGSM